MGSNEWSAKLRGWVEQAARAAGFDLVGVAAVRDPGEPAAVEEAERFEAWIDAGYAGEMEYLKRRDEAGRLLRSGLQVAMPWTRSVVVCAMRTAGARSSETVATQAAAPRSVDPAPPGTGWIASYAWSGRRQDDGSIAATDYHEEMIARLRAIEAGLLTQAQCTTRCYVDTGPMLERSLAAQAGVGWIGKNTCVINQQLGSGLLLGVIVTSLPMAEGVAELAAADRCGSCTRCIDACPTGALLGSKSADAPRTMDASRCIAYLTIEKKGAIDENLRAQMGRQVFGCEICQDVCPWNRRASIDVNQNMGAPSTRKGWDSMQPRVELVNPALDWLAAMDAREFKRRFKGSPLERTGRKRLLRNVAIAMGNSGEARFLPQLDEWVRSDDAVLAEAAAWARTRLLAYK
ncbi:MAG: tRNA epoxyqueuosine(34) reductase QueG [Acidobacteriaceae bacterium]|nr:tRNA epoxyqueuosine(34) reductase QueG [Acidobacteriaceae bacterium]